MTDPAKLRQRRDELFAELKALGRISEAVALRMRYAVGHLPGSRERVIAETEELVQQHKKRRGAA